MRGSHALAGGGACLALLLLLYYGGSDAPRPPSAPRRAPPAAPTPPAPPPAINTTRAPSPPRENVTSAPPAPPRAPPPPPPPAPGVVLAGALHEAGHAVAHPELCPALGRRLRLMVFVMSAPAHAEARAGIRLTWGHYAARADVGLAFLVGRVGAGAGAALETALAAEDQLYKDLIRGNFEDSYSNLTLKSLSMLEWSATYCPHARHILKTDDDMFINIPRLLAFAEKHSADRRTIYGKVVRKWGPNRSTKSKYYVSRSQYPAKVFPNFATGPAYLLTADCVQPLLERALTLPFVRLEDVFLTGVVAQALGLRRVHVPEFFNKELPPHPCTVRKAISLHKVKYAQQFDLWRKLLDGKAACGGG